MNEINKIIYNTTRVPVIDITRISVVFSLNSHISISNSTWNPTRDCVCDAIDAVMKNE